MDPSEPSKILIIEDDDSVRDVLTRFLNQNSIEVMSACNGDLGLEIIKNKTFDCVLLDLVMPGISGFEVLRRIRKLYSRVDLPVILTTGDRDKRSILEGFDIGANDYVTKPFDLRVLLARISSQLEMKSQSDANLLNRFITHGIQVGTQFGNFEILELLGAGGMGSVFRAKDMALDRIVALKTLLPSLELETKQIRRFRQEAKIIAHLNHPHIVKIMEIGRNPQNYFTMEYVQGSCLSEYLKHTKMTVEEKVRIVAQTASALHAAHAKKIIHRDVKPSNIMIDYQKKPKLLDFGTAKVLESTANLTLSFDVIGTPIYMAPEQVDSDSENIDAVTDIYGLGIVFYEMLTGSPPFTGPPLKVIWQIANQDPAPPRLVAPEIPRQFEKICLKAISKRKPDRYQSAAEFEEALLGCVG